MWCLWECMILMGGDVASTIYYGLFALQHRGQESCGIAVSDTYGPKGKVTSYKGMGLANEVFTQENLEKMIAYNVSNQKNYALRVVPLFLKKPAIKLVYLMSAKATTTTITNMGQMMVDEAYRPYIKRFQIILSPSVGRIQKQQSAHMGMN